MTLITDSDLDLVNDALIREADRRTKLAHRLANAITAEGRGNADDVVGLLADSTRLVQLAHQLPDNIRDLEDKLAQARAETYAAHAHATEVVDLEPDDKPTNLAAAAAETTRRNALDAANRITNADAADVTNTRRNADLGTLLDAQLATLTQHLNGDHA